MPSSRASRTWSAAALGLLLGCAPLASAFTAAPNLTINGDLRLRYESDWDSHTTSGTLRPDRERGRFRLRATAAYKFSDTWSFGARLRSGNHQSQQSPHLTFTADDGPSDDLEFALDRYFIQFKQANVTAWAGRNSSPFWQQNEMFWDEDITPTGAAASFDTKHGEATLTTTVGAFALPDGVNRLNGQLFAGQLKYSLPLKPAQFILAAGLHAFSGESGARYLINRNGARDYLVGVLSAQWSVPVQTVPFALGVDLLKNFEDYSAADVAPFPAASADETSGYVLSAQLGQLKNPRDWFVGYYYAHIEAFATNAAYAQDDWVRFGNGPQTEGTNIKGHEFRVAYALTKNLNLMARLFLVDAITTVQDGKRFRLDLNWKW
ncbi:putative porin [Opitutus terrae]|uniref:putative porin n=1 Tax=Opitutus terrae TaxID=107709 RepID=UPI0002E08B28|nr:putative porin [Opitutus terrae]